MTKPLLVALAAAAAGCAAPNYLARINGEEITGRDLRAQFGRQHRGLEKYLATDREVRSVLAQAIDKRLVAQEAHRVGVQDDPSVRATVAALRERKAIEVLVRQEIDEKAKPTPEEIQAAYELTGESLLIRELVAATQAEAEQLRNRVVAGEDLPDLARSLSIAPTKAQGGLWEVRWGDPEPERESAAFPMHKGDVSPVFPTKLGFAFFRLEDRKTLQRPPQERAEGRIRAVIERRKQVVRDRELIAALRQKYAAEAAECDYSLSSLEKARSEKEARVCARWKGGTLTLSDMAERMPIDNLRRAPADAYAKEARMRADDVLAERLLVAEAFARGLDRAPEVLEAVRIQEEALVVDRFLDRYVTQEVVVTDQEVAAYYDEHRAEMVNPEARLLAQVVAADAEAAAKVQRRLGEGERFEAVAADSSKHPEQARQGGMVGWMGKKDVPPSFHPVFAAQVGEVVGPIPADDGLHLVKVLDVRPAKPLEKPAALAQIQEEMLSTRRTKRFEKFVEALRKNATIEVSDAGIARYLEESPLPKVRPPPAMGGMHGAGSATGKP